MAALAAGEETDIEAWVDACYGETSSEWRNLIAMDSRMELAEDLPPLIESEDLIYGEFGISSFFEVIDDAMEHATLDSPQKVVDLGSGCGRLVLALARRRPKTHCIGMEYQRRLHDIGERALAVSKFENATLVCGDLHDANALANVLAGCVLCFVYSTAMFAEDDGQDIAARLSDALFPACDPGALVITTDRKLRADQFELLRADKEKPGSISGATVDIYLSRRRR